MDGGENSADAGAPARWTRARVVARYALFQIPDLALLSLVLAVAVRWWDLPVRGALLLVACWVVKDVLMFPVTRVAFEPGGATPSDRLTGAEGIARESLDPRGYVRVGSELWRAAVRPEHAPVASGARVRVVGVRGLTLLVEPARDTGAGGS